MPRMRGRSMRSGTELAQDIQLTDWSRAREHVKNLSNQFSGVQISCDICTRFGRYLYSTKQCWIIKLNIGGNLHLSSGQYLVERKRCLLLSEFSSAILCHVTQSLLIISFQVIPF